MGQVARRLLRKSGLMFPQLRSKCGCTAKENDDSRIDAKHAKFGEIEDMSFFALLASWRDKMFAF
jgi:hypothetical protein